MQQRTFVSAVNAASRPSLQPAQKAVASSFVQQTRGAKTVDFAGDKEKVYGRRSDSFMGPWRAWLTRWYRAR